MKNIKGKLKLFALTGSALMMLNGCAKEEIKETQAIESTIEESEEVSEMEKLLENLNLNYPYLVFDTTYLRNSAETPNFKSRYRIIKVEKKNNRIIFKDAFYTAAEVNINDIGGLNIYYNYGESEHYHAYEFEKTLRPLNEVLKELNYDGIKEDYSYTESELSSIYKDLFSDYKQSYAEDDIIVCVLNESDRKFHFLVGNIPSDNAIKTYYDIKDKRSYISIDKINEKIIVRYSIYDGDKEYSGTKSLDDGTILHISEVIDPNGNYNGYFRYSDLIYYEDEINKEVNKTR